MKSRTIRELIMAALLAALVTGAGVGVAGETENLAAGLARLRTEVEGLNSDLEFKKNEFRARLASLAAQKADLEAQARREEIRVAQLEAAVAKKRAENLSRSAEGVDLKPGVLAEIDRLKSYIQSSLPFKRVERLADLDRLAEDVTSGKLPAEQAYPKIWAAIEDEFRLTREVGLYQQTVTVDGQEMIADVARLGMVLLYFRTPDGRMGQAVKCGQDWEFKTIAGADDRERLEKLFAALDKRIREGFFELPNLTGKAGE